MTETDTPKDAPPDMPLETGDGAARDRLLKAAVAQVAFEGWSDTILEDAAAGDRDPDGRGRRG